MQQPNLSSPKLLLSGNEAVALGALHGGVRLAAAYPGTPSTEILETIAARHPEIYAEWAPNEKVALEVGMGAAFAGARVLVTMKHVGLNVAADPLFTLAYTGTKGGIVIVSADDPGMHSSQNEQDNRNYGPFAKVPMFEPADSQEAYEFMRQALQVSEDFDTPVILRMTTRVCHGKSIVTPTEPVQLDRPMALDRDPGKYVMVPGNAKRRQVVVHERTAKLAEWAETAPVNSKTAGTDGKLGIVTAGVSYQYAREILPEASILKLGMLHPLPEKKIREFASRFESIFVLEELDPYLETRLRAMGLNVQAKPAPFQMGELDPDRVRDIFGIAHPSPDSSENIPPRPPVLCPGCPHRATYTVLKKLKMRVTGDIGCYTLGALPPISSVDTCVCMGAGIGNAMGLSKVLPKEEAKKIVAVIGDSTFMHSGITGLLDMVYNGGDCTVLILDNRTTAMTGRQNHPGTGKTLMGKPAPHIDLEALCRSLGVQHVVTVNPLKLEESEKTIREAVAFDGPAVVIELAPCVLINRKAPVVTQTIDPEQCKDCGMCARTGCPAIKKIEKGYTIDTKYCRGCELCAQLCKFGAIGPSQL